MKRLSIALGTVLVAAAASATAQVYYYRPYVVDPYRVELRGDLTRECWNFRNGHFERVRPGEYQDDLDYRRCRVIGDRYHESRFYDTREECWNPRAGHYEAVRPGERQDDLDFARCRVVNFNRYAWR